MANCILIFKGQSQYNVLVRATEELMQGFREESGVAVEEVNIADENVRLVLKKAIESGELRPLFAFDMQGISLTTFDERPAIAWDCSFPIFAWIFDHPEGHFFRVKNLQRRNISMACVNRSDKDYIQRYYKPVSDLYFLPHGGFRSSGEKILFKDRIPGVFFSGGYPNRTKLEQELSKLSDQFRYVLLQCREGFMRADLENKAWHIEIRRFLEENQISLEEEKEKSFVITILMAVDQYHRYMIRTQTIAALLDAGIPVAVVGKGWQNFRHHKKELLTVLSDKEGLPIDEVIRLMGNFQMVLNISDTLSQGSHERIPTAMLNGTICLSNPSTYLLEKYEDKKEILYYNPSDLSTLPAAVKWVWENQAEAEALTQRAYEKAMASDTWQHRAKEILEIIKSRKKD